MMRREPCTDDERTTKMIMEEVTNEKKIRKTATATEERVK